MSPRRISALTLILLMIVSPAYTGATQADEPAQADFAVMSQAVTEASRPVTDWDGPRSGPEGRRGVRLAIVCEDLHNGGVLGVALGIKEAAEVLGWQLHIFDARGTAKGRRESLDAALAMKPDGLILLGSDADNLRPELDRFSQRGIPIVGWHIGPQAGRLSAGGVAINVSTDPLEVARITAMAAIVDSGGTAGVVIFTDSNFQIAMTKAETMADLIRDCADCRLLEIHRLPISQASQKMAGVTRELLNRYGNRWTHALAINDIYFDYAAPELTRTGRDIKLLSAGDGSPAALLRIQAGTFQHSTVAEPLNLQGWQLLDELNRLLADQPVSGYVMPAHLITQANSRSVTSPQLAFDPDNGYREIYKRIWNRP